MTARESSASAQAGTAPSLVRILEVYYLATPAFLLLDILFGVPLRVSTLDTPLFKYGYYTLSLGCGLAIQARPRAAPFIGLGESAFNFLLVILGILGPYWQMVNQAGDPNATLTNPFTPVMFVNAIIAGSIAVVSIKANQARIWLSLVE